MPKKQKKSDDSKTEPATDPQAVLRHPTHPPKRNAVAFLLFAMLLVVWLLYLTYVAMYG